ncbi:YegS/Rv2252/BmrU family lipid kinase [Fusibacter bizertensis]|uniref:YegS/Rv2252/BmrU family lipid kinase n=1 Tax=Fusibacter bizertensis TaxID=1488331 RepID=A0ABT6NC53_9FIRM|nr:YegS/Rv2252/BmrU family lipid kinase [Fusibacter bizertensis]MDH8678003.1 YegS/Rv2252/BmrU family lipid kinase [Fusibacter bizertensis]
MNVLLMYNPRSGTRSFQAQLDYVVDRFQTEGMQIIPYRMNDMNRLETYLKNIDVSTFKKIIISGGDGTVHQVVNCMMRLGIDLPIAIFPTGTANDFSQYFEIPKDIEGMTEVALKDQYVDCDLGKVNDQYFINVASFGNLVDISQRVNEQAKNVIGVLAYYIKGIEEIPKLRAFKARIGVDDVVIEAQIYFVLIMNGKSAGGFRKLAPYSDISDGLLDVLVFKKCPVLELMPLLIQVWNGEHPKSDYIQYTQAKKITVECSDAITSDLDGETGPALPLEIEVVKSCIKVNSAKIKKS